MIRVLLADDQELARALDPDVVLMDVRMPRMDGIEATRRLAAELVISLATVKTYVRHVLQKLRLRDRVGGRRGLRVGTGA